MKYLVQVNGNIVLEDNFPLVVAADTVDALEKKVVAIPSVLKAVGAREVKKIVVIPNKLINIIARLKKSYEY